MECLGTAVKSLKDLQDNATKSSNPRRTVKDSYVSLKDSREGILPNSNPFGLVRTNKMLQ